MLSLFWDAVPSQLRVQPSRGNKRQMASHRWAQVGFGIGLKLRKIMSGTGLSKLHMKGEDNHSNETMTLLQWMSAYKQIERKIQFKLNVNWIFECKDLHAMQEDEGRRASPYNRKYGKAGVMGKALLCSIYGFCAGVKPLWVSASTI